MGHVGVQRGGRPDAAAARPRRQCALLQAHRHLRSRHVDRRALPCARPQQLRRGRLRHRSVRRVSTHIHMSTVVNYSTVQTYISVVLYIRVLHGYTLFKYSTEILYK